MRTGSNRLQVGRIGVGLVYVLSLLAFGLGQEAMGESCTTQAKMAAVDRDGIAAAAQTMAGKVLAGDVAGLKALTLPEYAKDFENVSFLVTSTAPRIKGAALAVEQVYVLDATTLKGSGDGSPVGQFFCSLNQSTNEADFTIPGLPAGRYGFAIVEAQGGAGGAWRISVLMRQQGTQWLLANLFPRAETANGRDGLKYWTEARSFTTAKEPWNAWLYYGEAEALLRPANFVTSTHLDKLRQERVAAAPPVLSEGVNLDAPLVVKAADGTEFHFVGLGTDASPDGQALDVAAHLKVDTIGDPAAARTRNAAAMTALLAAYPELRKAFHGVWVYTEATGENPFPTEQAMAQVR